VNYEYLPHGSLVHREYRVTVRDHAGAVAFTLGDIGANTAGARLAQFAEARLYGLIAILGVPGAPRYPVIWVFRSGQIGLAIAEEDRELSEDLKQIIADKIDVFFADIGSMVPDFNRFEVSSSSTQDRLRALN
jgi:NADPH-dependent curcumin reductase CurA